MHLRDGLFDEPRTPAGWEQIVKKENRTASLSFGLSPIGSGFCKLTWTLMTWWNIVSLYQRWDASLVRERTAPSAAESGLEVRT
jgi:hypothetical protein